MSIRPSIKPSGLPEIASISATDLVLLFNKANNYQASVMGVSAFSIAASEGGSSVVVTAVPIVANARYTIVTSAVTIIIPNSPAGTMKTVKGTVNGVIVDPASGTVDGSATATLNAYQSIAMVTDGTNWWIV